MLGEGYFELLCFEAAILTFLAIYCNIFKRAEMKFEWDENKNAENVKKHEVDFNYATGAFFDPKSRELYYDNN